MSAEGVQDSNASEQIGNDTPMDSFDKGKGKAPAEDDVMDEDESSEDDEENEGEVEGEVEEADEDNMEEIDMDNIVGSRTRGKNIDYAQAAKEMEGQEDDDEDEEDDEDFVDDDDKMQD